LGLESEDRVWVRAKRVRDLEGSKRDKLSFEFKFEGHTSNLNSTQSQTKKINPKAISDKQDSFD
jgi:hypothetical protein